METVGFVILAVIVVAVRMYVRHLISEALWGPSRSGWEEEAARLESEDMFGNVGRSR